MTTAKLATAYAWETGNASIQDILSELMSNNQHCIDSLLENDAYKISMLQVMLHKYPGTHAKYSFLCRNTTQYPLATLKAKIEAELDHLCTLQFTEVELNWLSSIRYVKPDFVEFLRLFKLQRKYIKVLQVGDSLSITAEGPILHVMMFELYVLAIVNEIYFRSYYTPEFFKEGIERLDAKIEKFKSIQASQDAKTPFDLIDFGFRRRAGHKWQDYVVYTLKNKLPAGILSGTSNMHLARKYALTAKGTMAHEYLQMYQGLPYQLKLSQKQALEDWVQEYRGDLGIALTDVICMDAFLKDFDLFFAKLFDGLRHDSGDPVEWGEKAIAHYQKLGIDPLSKILVFSDGLDPDSAAKLYEHFRGRIKMSFGIGTNLTNDLGVKALNIVMKMIECNGNPVAKLSDSPGKTMCENHVYVEYLKQTFEYPH